MLEEGKWDVKSAYGCLPYIIFYFQQLMGDVLVVSIQVKYVPRVKFA